MNGLDRPPRSLLPVDDLGRQKGLDGVASDARWRGVVSFGSLSELLACLLIETDVQHGRDAVAKRRSPDSSALPVKESFDVDLSGLNFERHALEVSLGQNFARLHQHGTN